MDLAEGFPGDVLIVPFSKAEESRNGADWAWAFQSADRNHTLPMLVQAKVLDLKDRAYDELKRHVGKATPPVRQIDLLIKSAINRGWPAIYAFYNHLNNVRRIPNSCGTLRSVAMPESWGIAIANAHKVRAELDRPRRSSDQKFDTHKKHSIPLHCLLCSFGRGRASRQGSPGLALAALKRLPGPTTEGDVPPLPDEPLREVPPLFQRAREIATSRNQARRDAQLQELAQEFPDLAGVVILRDQEDDASG